jgi:hypothetical protein
MSERKEGIDGAELGLACACGHENFERVVVQRRPHPPVVTDFVACVGCRSMYFAPLRAKIAQKPALPPGFVGVGGPPTD